MTQSRNTVFIQIRKSDYLVAIHVAYFHDKNRESERQTLRGISRFDIREDTNERRCNGRRVPTMKLFQWQLWKLPRGASPPSPSSGRAEGRRDGWNPGKILRANSMYWTDLLLAWLSSIVVQVRSAFEPLTRYKSEKIKTFRVHSREFLQSSLPIL